MSLFPMYRRYIVIVVACDFHSWSLLRYKFGFRAYSSILIIMHYILKYVNKQQDFFELLRYVDFYFLMFCARSISLCFEGGDKSIYLSCCDGAVS